MSGKELDERYCHLRRLLQYAVHEMPAGVLYDANSANVKQCSEWMVDLNEFERICAALHHDHLKPMVVPLDTTRQTLGGRMPTTVVPNRRSVRLDKPE